MKVSRGPVWQFGVNKKFKVERFEGKASTSGRRGPENLHYWRVR